MFPKQRSGVETQKGGERHCILVASTNPNSLPRPLYLPIIKNGDFWGPQTEWRVGDFETVAHSYAQVIYLCIYIYTQYVHTYTHMYMFSTNY